MKPKILIFLKPFLPGYKSGGPIQSIKNLIDNLYEYYDFYIVTNDREYSEDKSYPNIKYGIWNDVYNAKIRYLSKKEDNFTTYKKIIKELEFDLLYLQSFWCINYSLIPTILTLLYKKEIPILVHPRGQLYAGALKHNNLKKKIFILLYKVFNLYRKVFFNVSTDEEKETIIKTFIDIKQESIFIANNFPKKIEYIDLTLPKNKILKLVYLSRIDNKKNLLELIRQIKEMNINIEFDIYGPVFNRDYFNECYKEIKENTKNNIVIKYNGVLEHNNVIDTIKQYDLFCFFTLGENFGHAICEALSSGLPVIISNQTPWHKLKEYNAGWEIPLEKPELIQEKILEYYNKTDEEKLKMRKGSLQYAMDVSNDNKIFNDNKNMFDSLINKRRNNLC